MRSFKTLAILVGVLFSSSAFSASQEMTAKDGSRLVYDDVGSGTTPLVFIHCLSCNKSYWKNEIEPFSKDYRLILLDLPGHGESKPGKKIPDTVEAMAREVVAVMDHLNLKGAILVGSSMGGPIALEAARLRPKRVVGVIGVDNLHNAEGGYPKEMFVKMGEALEKDFAQGMKGMMPHLFTPKSDPKIIEWTTAEAVKADPTVVRPLFQNLADVDLKKMMKNAKVPIRNINALPNQEGSPKTETAINRKYADFDVIEMAGVGHFPMLEKPEEFNADLKTSILSILSAKKP